jgi:hypothetical protein
VSGQDRVVGRVNELVQDQLPAGDVVVPDERMSVVVDEVLCDQYAVLGQPDQLSEKPQGLLDEVLVELEDAAVPGVRVDHELAVR